MSNKFANLNRRDFLTKASLLLAGVGATPLMRAEMLQKFTKKFMPEALAEELAGNRVHHFIELTFRSGLPLINIGASKEMQMLPDVKYSNSPYAPDSLFAAGRAEQPIFLNPMSQALQPYAHNLAITQGVQSTNGHTSNWSKRRGGNNGNSPAPIVEHAARMGGNFIVSGVHWYGGNSVVNNTGSYSDLQNVGGSDAFNSLYQKAELRLNDREVAAVAEAAKGLSRKQAELLSHRMKDASKAVTSQAKGADLLTTDFAQLLSVSDQEAQNFRVGMSRVDGRGWADIGQAFVSSVKAMQHGLLGDAQITVRSGDWHGFRSAGTDTYQAQAAEHLSVLLAELMKVLKTTPSITAPGKMMDEVTLIAINSEFTRGVRALNSDNSDGGTDGILLFGSMINGGYYGSFDTSDNNARAYGFDPISGAATTGMRNSPGGCYNTVQNLLGNPTVSSGSETWTAMIKKT